MARFSISDLAPKAELRSGGVARGMSELMNTFEDMCASWPSVTDL